MPHRQAASHWSNTIIHSTAAAAALVLSPMRQIQTNHQIHASVRHSTVQPSHTCHMLHASHCIWEGGGGNKIQESFIKGEVQSREIKWVQERNRGRRSAVQHTAVHVRCEERRVTAALLLRAARIDSPVHLHLTDSLNHSPSAYWPPTALNHHHNACTGHPRNQHMPWLALKSTLSRHSSASTTIPSTQTTKQYRIENINSLSNSSMESDAR